MTITCKRFLLLAAVLLSAAVTRGQQTYDHPPVESAYVSPYGTMAIERVVVGRQYTRVLFSYEVQRGYENISLSLSANTTLRTGAGENYRIVGWGVMQNEKTSPLEFDTPYGVDAGQRVVCYMTFPAVPAGTQTISINEVVENGNGFYWRGIRLANGSGSPGPKSGDQNSGGGSQRGEPRADSDGSRGGPGSGQPSQRQHTPTPTPTPTPPQAYSGGGDDSPDNNSGEPGKGQNPGKGQDPGKGEYAWGDKGSSPFSDQRREREAPFNPTASGSCFALTEDGLLATCYHVVEDARRIRIRGVGGDFDRLLTAVVVATDRENDLAIMRIDDTHFTALPPIPYRVEKRLADVGESVFTLGYPLRAVMGDEIKLTSGVVSAQSGYMGDTTSYQLSAAVQSGNSGGPAFNADGNVIGVVNARLQNVESASYAVKQHYLFNLLQQAGLRADFRNARSMAGETMANKVKLVKPYIFIVEVES